jgi:hypothetical protein
MKRLCQVNKTIQVPSRKVGERDVELVYIAKIGKASGQKEENRNVKQENSVSTKK